MAEQIGSMVESMIAAGKWSQNMKKQDEMWTRIRLRYYELIRKAAWADCRDEKTISFAGATSAGMLLPANLVRIMGVRSSSSTYGYREYVSRDEGQLDVEEDRYRWYYASTVTEAHAEGMDLSINSGDSVFTAATMTSILADTYGDNEEFIKFGKELGFYQISGSVTKGISPTYRGPNLADVRWQVRPPGTKYMNIWTPDDQQDTNSVTVFYWKYPPQLYRDTDVALLPSLRPLELLVMIDMGVDVTRNTKELVGPNGNDGAMVDMVNQNPRFVMSGIQRDVNGASMTFAGDIFGSRQGTQGVAGNNILYRDFDA